VEELAFGVHHFRQDLKVVEQLGVQMFLLFYVGILVQQSLDDITQMRNEQFERLFRVDLGEALTDDGGHPAGDLYLQDFVAHEIEDFLERRLTENRTITK
jgi:hypothetical protein